MGESAAPLLPALKAIVGDANVLTAAADTAAFVTDWRDRYHGHARAVVRPGDTEEVAAVVRCCADNGVAVVPQGGNTGLCGGATPHASGDEVVISLARLNRVRAIDADNATMTVDAGVPLAAVQEAATNAGTAVSSVARLGRQLRDRRQPLDQRRWHRGDPLRQRARARARPRSRARGRHESGTACRGLRKDNTGYDLKQLFLGSEGTLGIITAAVLKLFPRPRTSVTAWVGGDRRRRQPSPCCARCATRWATV